MSPMQLGYEIVLHHGPVECLPARIVVLASGAGSLANALIQAAREDYPARVVAIGVDRPCLAQQVATQAAIPSFMVSMDHYESREDWDKALREVTAAYRPDYVVSAGFMRILGPGFIEHFPGRILNTHPALLPAFPGAHAVADALAYGVKVTGCSMHIVDSGVDTGPIIAQRVVEICDDDDEHSLHERIKTIERVLLVEVIARIVTGGITCSDRKVTLG